MTYTKILDEAKYTEIRAITDELATLTAGEETSVSGLNPHELAHTRWLIYDWLYHNGVKNLFRVKTERDSLIIKRTGNTSIPRIEKRNSNLALGAQRILAELVALDNLKAAETKLMQMAMDKQISTTELGELLLELRRIFT